MEGNDSYVTSILEKKGDTYITKLLNPIRLGVGHNAKIALCDLQYCHDNSQFKNAPNSTVFIAIPRLTKAPKNETRGKTYEVKFISCRPENAEYTPQSLIDALNVEFKAKLPSKFRPDQCQFIYNQNVDRTELTLDGPGAGVEAQDQVTLIVYHPLSRYLGFTNSTQASATYCFVSNS